ncbi:Rab-like protein 3, partial [Orchesella cincta]
MTNYDKVKIVVVGDSGVGKTSAVHLICYNKPLSSPSWTVGVSLEVKLHDFKAGTPQQKPYFIELWDIGGSSSHRNSRSVFYNGVNGVILVHDLGNRKSEANLRKWLKEIFTSKEKDSNTHHGGGGGASLYMSGGDDDDFDPEQFVGSTQIPVFVIGTKQDGIGDGNRLPVHSRASLIAEECGAEEIFMNCLDVKSLSPGSTAAVKICRFFDKVVERRFHKEQPFNTFYDRRKIYPQSTKSYNEDFF